MVSMDYRSIFLFGVFWILTVTACSSQAAVREYWIAAEKTAWNYAPSGKNLIDEKDGLDVWGETLVYQKYRYIGYEDNDFSAPTAT